MDVNITISDESKFNEVIKNELEAFTKEELHNIVGKALLNYFSDEKHVKELFYKEVTDHWGSTRRERAEFFDKLIPSGDIEITNDLLKEVKEKLRAVLTNDEAVRAMIRETWFSNLASRVESNLVDTYAIRNAVAYVLDEMRQQGQL